MRKILVLATLLAFPLACAAAVAPPAATGSNAVVQYLEGKGLTVQSRFSIPGGLEGYAGLTPDGKRIVFYTTADGSLALFGALIDAHGHNLSKEYQDAYVQTPRNQQLYAQLAKADWIGVGASHPTRIVYAFVDPNCPFCRDFWQSAQAAYGKGVQIRYLVVAILGDSSVKKAAAILEAKDPKAALDINERGFRHHSGAIHPVDHVSDKVRTTIASHNRLMEQFGLDGTPGLVWKNGDGKVQTSDGLPPRDDLDRILGLTRVRG